MIEPSRLMLLGDTHGNSAFTVQAIQYAAENGCNAILQVGDWGHWSPGVSTKFFLSRVHEALAEHDVTLHWVDGNHEDHADIQKRLVGGNPQALYKAYPRIVYLPRGYRWGWFGKTWMALGGAYSVDRPWRTEGKSWWPGEVLSDGDVEYASRPGDVDVLIAHDVPFGVNVPGIGTGEMPNTGSGFPLVSILQSIEHRKRVKAVVDATRPKLIVHGHMHVRYESLYTYSDGVKALVQGLDCDGSPMDRSTLFINAS